jgi:hypothetical protein
MPDLGSRIDQHGEWSNAKIESELYSHRLLNHGLFFFSLLVHGDFLGSHGSSGVSGYVVTPL